MHIQPRQRTFDIRQSTVRVSCHDGEEPDAEIKQELRRLDRLPAARRADCGVTC